VRRKGETGSHRDPQWSGRVSVLGKALDAAVNDVVGDRTLSDLVDEQGVNET